ncbi:unnamed protein product [Toxocara canis]|uniref:HECW_N domain-containing protein n=1 Tax=Toxocara canis TaxID=6265 RepID=A0A183U6Z9_TOXCA|nr:unnamed protein product [Toxocara canis]
MAASSRSPFTLIIRRNTQVARAADPITGCERWNLSVAEYSISLASSGRSSNNYFSEPTPSMVRFRLRPPDGVISAISSGGVPIWEQDLNSPIARVWHLFNGRINEVIEIMSSKSRSPNSPYFLSRNYLIFQFF